MNVTRHVAAQFLRYAFGHRDLGAAGEDPMITPHSPELLALTEGAMGRAPPTYLPTKGLQTASVEERVRATADFLRAVAEEISPTGVASSDQSSSQLVVDQVLMSLAQALEDQLSPLDQNREAIEIESEKMKRRELAECALLSFRGMQTTLRPTTAARIPKSPWNKVAEILLECVDVQEITERSSKVAFKDAKTARAFEAALDLARLVSAK